MKILLLHASAGAGHKRAAQALEKGFRAASPEAEIRVCDILDFTAPLFRKTYGEGYLDVVRKAPELWGYMYAQSDRQASDPIQKKLRSFINKTNTLTFTRFFNDFAPDIAVCTHFMPLEILSSRLQGGTTTASLFCSVTDFAVHSLWILENVACYYVATEEARRQLLRRGQPDDRIAVSGIPIDPVFSTGLPPAEARRRLNLDPSQPAVLLLSGGCGVGPAVELIRATGAADLGCRLLVVAGNNAALKEQAEAAARELGIAATVYGFVNNIHELMDAADLVISKPGGLTSSEVLAKGKPMLIIDPIPGQEQRNCEFLLEAGAAARLFDIEDAGFKIRSLLSDAPRLARMGENARRIGHTSAAADIAADILKRHASSSRTV
jgi:processive 1,2-diacylglycerol beta-glucosyltransferase